MRFYKMFGLTMSGIFAAQGLACDRGALREKTLSISQNLGTASTDYCALPTASDIVLRVRPGEDEEPIDDVNWFARPVPHGGSDRIIAFASHDQNYLYNLTTGDRIRIPDRSDAVATPDGRYMTVPSFYTPDSTIRFYPMKPLLERLDRGEDASDVEPAFIHDHASMGRVYYQSTALVSEVTGGDRIDTTYRLMFSGTADESQFRIVDYIFSHDRETLRLLSVQPSQPMRVCPEVHNDLNTPFISKDGRYVAAYTSESTEASFSPGSSLKVFEITSIDDATATTSCREVVDFGFAAGKADFSFDGTMLAFHISQGAYLTPFVNAGLPSSTITDVVVARLATDDRGDIVGHAGLRRLTTSMQAGVGSYFPAFFQDGSLFFIANSVPKNSSGDKRFHFRVMDPESGGWQVWDLHNWSDPDRWAVLARHWETTCVGELSDQTESPFPLKMHEAPWLGLSLSAEQCNALVSDARAASSVESDDVDWQSIRDVCAPLSR